MSVYIGITLHYITLETGDEQRHLSDCGSASSPKLTTVSMSYMWWIELRMSLHIPYLSNVSQFLFLVFLFLVEIQSWEKKC